MPQDLIDDYFDGLVQDCSNSIANALELLQSCTKPSTFELPSGTKPLPEAMLTKFYDTI